MNYFQKHKRKLITLFVVASVLSFIYIWNSVNQNTSSPSPRPPISITPTPAGLALINKYPPDGDIPFTFPNTAISFTFNQPIKQYTVNITSSPSILLDYYYSQDFRTIYLKPRDRWIFNTKYTISLEGFNIPVQTIFTPVDPSKSEEIFDESFEEEH